MKCDAVLSAAFAACSDATDAPAHFSLRPSPGPSESSDVMSLFRLEYSVDEAGPLGLILNKLSLQMYVDLWRMLMQLQQMLYACRSLWGLFKDLTRPISRTEGVSLCITRLSIIRHDVQHFVNSLQVSRARAPCMVPRVKPPLG
jgi:hypothetical protein